MDLDGNNQINLTNSPVSEYDPSISFDGSQLTFISDACDGPDSEIFVIDVDGSNKRRLTDNSRMEYTPRFSPDGSMIVFISDRPGNVHIMDAFGHYETNLTDYQAPYSHLAFAPGGDGTRIVFLSFRRLQQDIFMTNLNGNDEIQLTNMSGFKGGEEPPQVSPDGSTITFSSYKIIESEMIVDIYLVNVDGSNLTNLTHGSINGFMPKFQPNR